MGRLLVNFQKWWYFGSKKCSANFLKLRSWSAIIRKSAPCSQRYRIFFLFLEKITFVSFSLKIEWVSKNGVFFFPSCIFFSGSRILSGSWDFYQLRHFWRKKFKNRLGKKNTALGKKIQNFPDLSEWVDTIFSKEEKKYDTFALSDSQLVPNQILESSLII